MSQALLDQIAALERVIKREKAGKKQAELELENYSSQVYQANLTAEEQGRQAQKKQEHLSFLTGVAAEIWKHASVRDLIENYLQRCHHFLNDTVCCFFRMEKDYSRTHIQTYCRDESLINQNCNISDNKVHEIFDHLDCFKIGLDLQKNSHGQLFNVTELSKQEYSNYYYQNIFILPLFHKNSHNESNLGLVCFFYHDKDAMDIFKLQTLESSRANLAIAIEQKQADKALKKRLIDLEESNQALEKAHNQLIESEKLASLGLLSAGIAHEINNPIGYVLSNLDSMKDYLHYIETTFKPLEQLISARKPINFDGSDKFQQNWQQYDLPYLLEDSREIINSSLDGLLRVKEIINDLGRFSRMDDDELEPTNINEVLTKTLKMLNNEFKYQFQVDTYLEANNQILGNESQLQQVFVNLLMNAKHAMPEGGLLTIRTYKEKGRIKVSIKDQGHGIEKKHLKDVFTPFFTTKGPGKGTGLGLSISYSILQQHHAKVDINSKINEGTEFILSFFSFE